MSDRTEEREQALDDMIADGHRNRGSWDNLCLIIGGACGYIALIELVNGNIPQFLFGILFSAVNIYFGWSRDR